jgi:hypothetical protein
MADQKEELHPVLLSDRDVRELLSLLPDPFKVMSQVRADYINALAARLAGDGR